MAPTTIVALEGDQTGQELLEQALRVLDPQLLGVELEVVRFDLSLESRRATKNGVVSEAAEAMRGPGSGSRRRRSRRRAPTTSAARTGSSARRSTAR